MRLLWIRRGMDHHSYKKNIVENATMDALEFESSSNNNKKKKLQYHKHFPLTT
jgi:hypothetical protein